MTEEKHECPPHHFMIDSENVGRCRYCPEVRDFGKLQRRAERETSKKVEGNPYGRTGRKKKEPANRVKMSVAAKERWQSPEYQGKQSAARQSPEYRGKQSAAMKKHWQDPEYQAKMNGRKRRNLKHE